VRKSTACPSKNQIRSRGAALIVPRQLVALGALKGPDYLAGGNVEAAIYPQQPAIAVRAGFELRGGGGLA
jgi:hypothetical protein